MAERRSGLMTLSRRGSAVCFAAVLILHLALFPFRARAMSATMAAVGGAVVVSAALVACGIYPYVSEDGQTFGEWGAERLSDLWAQYVSSFEGGSTPSGGTVQTFEQIKAYVTGGTLVISRSVWETLQSFIAWVKQTFSLSDNQEDVTVNGVAVSSDLPYTSTITSAWMSANGFSSGSGESGFLWAANDSGVKMAILGGRSSGGAYDLYLGSLYPSRTAYYTLRRIVSTVPKAGTFNLNHTSSYDSVPYYYYHSSSFNGSEGAFDNIPSFETSAEIAAYFVQGGSISSGGVTLDTATLGALPDIAADADYMGLSVAPGTVEGVAATMTPQAVQEIIQQGVTDRERPVVTPVEVTVAQGTDIDAATGTLTENPAVVDVGQAVAEYVPVVSDLAVPQSFLDSLVAAMQTKFPFCLPFDVMRLLSAFVKPPRAPVIGITFHDPFTNADYTFSVDLSPWDDVAAVVRQMESIFLFCGFWLNFDKFNVLNIILGSLG